MTIDGAASEAPGTDLRVMVVDDVEVVLSLLTDLLEAEEGLTVCATATNGTEAVTVALDARPDIVLMDLKMPSMDGITATKLIREQWPTAQIVINSAFGDRSLSEAALAAGAARFVTKDRRPRELIETLREVAAQSTGGG